MAKLNDTKWSLESEAVTRAIEDSHLGRERSELKGYLEPFQKLYDDTFNYELSKLKQKNS